jgi:hypothetical protein
MNYLNLLHDDILIVRIDSFNNIRRKKFHSFQVVSNPNIYYMASYHHLVLLYLKMIWLLLIKCMVMKQHMLNKLETLSISCWTIYFIENKNSLFVVNGLKMFFVGNIIDAIKRLLNKYLNIIYSEYCLLAQMNLFIRISGVPTTRLVIISVNDIEYSQRIFREFFFQIKVSVLETIGTIYFLNIEG